MRISSQRRHFMQLCGSLPLLAGSDWATADETLPAVLDLIVSGGRVIDPANGFDGPADIAIHKGRIVQIAPSLAGRKAGSTVDVAGKIVCPGLIDPHVHVAEGMMPVSINPDLAGIQSGVTTMVDAGSTGGRNFSAFRDQIIKSADTRIYTLMNISSVGLTVLNELYLDPKLISRKRALRAIRENRDIVIGLKARVHGTDETIDHDIGIMKIVREVSEEAGLPVMMHWTNKPALLDMLRPGDTMTHPFNPDYLNPGAVMPDGKLYPTVLELKDRGITVDLAHGSSFDWRKAEAAAAQGWYPDMLSTDMFTRYFRPDGVVGDLPAVMSKFRLLGLSMAQVIEKATVVPGKKLPLPLGTLSIGAIADLTVLDARKGKFVFVDSPRLKATRTGDEKLFPVMTIKSGRVFEIPALA